MTSKCHFNEVSSPSAELLLFCRKKAVVTDEIGSWCGTHRKCSDSSKRRHASLYAQRASHFAAQDAAQKQIASHKPLAQAFELMLTRMVREHAQPRGVECSVFWVGSGEDPQGATTGDGVHRVVFPRVPEAGELVDVIHYTGEDVTVMVVDVRIGPCATAKIWVCGEDDEGDAERVEVSHG